MRRAHGLAAVAAVVCTLTASLPFAAPSAAADDPVSPYQAPVDAEIIDTFRPPSQPWGSGNRGIDYATPELVPVRASAAGEVTFAGTVAGSLHVTVLHADGIRTSYSFLSDIAVVKGQQVRQGEVVGTSGTELHFGARLGDVYLDPLALLAGTAFRVRLVPSHRSATTAERDDRAYLAYELSHDDGFSLGGALGAVGRGLGRAGGVVWSGVEGAVTHIADRVEDTYTAARMIVRHLADLGEIVDLQVVLDWLEQRDRCTASDVAAPGQFADADSRIVVLVAGLGSTSETSAVIDVDTAALGYRDENVVQFSYGGGRVPDPTDAHLLQGLPASTYTAGDSAEDLNVAGDRLAQLLGQIAAERPGVAVDVIAHSQGGLVARLGTDGQRAGLPPIGTVATLATPHHGADMATAGALISTNPMVEAIVDRLEPLAATGYEHDSPSVRQLAEHSALIEQVARVRPDEATRLVSVAARTDVVVPNPQSRVEWAENIVVDSPEIDGLSAHDALPGSAVATRELALAVHGMHPSCRGLGEMVLDDGVGHAIEVVWDGLGTGIWAL